MNYEIDDVLCIIPARGGSKGIVDKNLQMLGGIPLVEHSIIHALKAGIKTNHIILSSDNDMILNVARNNYQIVCHKRPLDISGDSSSTEKTMLCVLKDHLKHAEQTNEFPCDHVLLLQPTSPLRFVNMLSRFIYFYKNGGYDSALTVTKFYDFFWQKSFTNQFAISSYDPQARPMRQELSSFDMKFFENGNAYLTNVECLMENQCRLGKNVGLFQISELEGMQIDTIEDLESFRSIFDGTITEVPLPQARLYLC